MRRRIDQTSVDEHAKESESIRPVHRQKKILRSKYLSRKTTTDQGENNFRLHLISFHASTLSSPSSPARALSSPSPTQTSRFLISDSSPLFSDSSPLFSDADHELSHLLRFGFQVLLRQEEAVFVFHEFLRMGFGSDGDPREWAFTTCERALDMTQVVESADVWSGLHASFLVDISETVWLEKKHAYSFLTIL
ncbi:hypothetical protein YC2023_033113 [Brassica napus]